MPHRAPLTYEQAAQYLNLSVRQLRDLVHREEIPVTRAGRLVRFLPDVLDDWLVAQTSGLDHVRKIVATTLADQGVPVTIDEVTLGRIAELLRAADASAAAA